MLGCWAVAIKWLPSQIFVAIHCTLATSSRIHFTDRSPIVAHARIFWLIAIEIDVHLVMLSQPFTRSSFTM
jgi:hypothetical protein